MARSRSPSVVRWVTKLVNRGGKQFRQRYKVAVKAAKKGARQAGKGIAKQAKREAKAFRSVRHQSRKKTARQKERQAKKKAAQEQKQPKKPTWREILVEGKRKWIRMAAGGGGSLGSMQAQRAAALKAWRGGKPTEAPTGLGKWHKTSADNRHQKHRDYVGPHKPPKRRQG